MILLDVSSIAANWSTVLSAVAAIITLIVLLWRDLKREAEVTAFMNISENTARQVQELIKQNGILIERNLLIEKQTQVMEAQSFQALEQEAKRERIKKRSIMPCFRMSSAAINGPAYALNFINTGGVAYDIKYNVEAGGQMIRVDKVPKVEKGEILTIPLSRGMIDDIKETHPDVQSQGVIICHDEDQTQYKQLFGFNWPTLLIGDPTSIKNIDHQQ